MYGYIYKTTNNINNKIYVGQKKSNKFKPNYFGSGTKIVLALKKYGKENFTTILIDSCESQEELDLKEQFWIKFYNAIDRGLGYNIKSGGQFYTVDTYKKLSEQNTGKTLSEEHKQKISNSLKLIPSNLRGNSKQHHSEETRKKQSAARKGYKPSLESIQKLALAHSKRVINLDTQEVFISVQEAMKKYSGNIYKCCNGFSKQAQGYHWAYLDDDGLPIVLTPIDKSKNTWKSVRNIDTGEVFKSINSAQRAYPQCDVCRCCKGKCKASGGYRWEYYIEDKVK